MKRLLFTFVAALFASLISFAANTTLRLDYIFAGDSNHTEIYLDEMSCFDGWAGRNVNMDSAPLRGNGQIIVKSASDGSVLYVNSFSTLFQEWKTTEEATLTRRSFENVFLVPMPDVKSVIRVELYTIKGELDSSFEHIYDPEDILVRRLPKSDAPVRNLKRSGAPETCIDVAIVAEGYTAAEAETFFRDATIAMDEILSYEPFATYSDRFNFIAVALPSEDSGVSIPKEGIWKDSALSSNFSTFYSDRYLTTLRLRKLHDSLAGLPYEHIIILANTDEYGGGGIYNSYTLTTAHHSAFRPVVVHEFGHSFAGLADEYYYDDMYSPYYTSEYEPWEQNITTLKDFSQKWTSLIPEQEYVPAEGLANGVRINSQVNQRQMWKSIREGVDPALFVGVYEGAGYQSKGVYRGYPDCRMHTNLAPVFCPVCQAAISELIKFNLTEKCK